VRTTVADQEIEAQVRAPGGAGRPVLTLHYISNAEPVPVVGGLHVGWFVATSP
jgi:hypothetical protein